MAGECQAMGKHLGQSHPLTSESLQGALAGADTGAVRLHGKPLGFQVETFLQSVSHLFAKYIIHLLVEEVSAFAAHLQEITGFSFK